MPSLPLRQCSAPGCAALTASGRCQEHTHALHGRINSERRPEVTALYRDRKWREYSKAFLAENPTCAACKNGTPASQVDHMIPHGGNIELFWDRRNHQALCSTCHSRKTAAEDGGFGNARK